MAVTFLTGAQAQDVNPVPSIHSAGEVHAAVDVPFLERTGPKHPDVLGRAFHGRPDSLFSGRH